MFSTAVIAKVIKEFSGNLFLYPGGTIAPLLQECKNIGVNLVVSKNEQGAGYMAIAEAQLNHKPSFAAVTSGPGATNIITPLADAYYDSVPLIAITGQVGTPDLERSSEIRQRGFQEVPIVNMVKEITKEVFQPRTIEELSDAIHNAYIISNEGRKGPVLIDLPMNIQLQEIDNKKLGSLLKLDTLTVEKKVKGEIDQNTISKTIDVLNNAQKPLVLIGGGAQEEWQDIRTILEKTNIPVISSLRGLGVFNGLKSYGWIGHTGTPWANKILFEADCVLVLGSRLDVRQTGSETKTLDEKKVIHVDIDSNELKECRVKNTIKINVPILEYLNLIDSKVNKFTNLEWLSRVDEIKFSTLMQDDAGVANGVNPSDVLKYIDKNTNDKMTLFSTGVGSHQHWTSRYINFDNKMKKIFTSAGHGTMGFGLPTALGLNYLERDSRVICIDGDGSFQINIQELALINELNLNLKILVMDNSRLGIVSQFQNITFGKDPTTGDFLNPDFVEIAKAYKLEAYYIKEYDETIISQWLNSEKAALLHVKVKHDAPISPMLLGGQKLNEMWQYEG
ncbi:thiamine pyrophosphate-binding protein [Halarcobacter anaerophilus]|uniref:Acetolactate synthase n=1 Tax=Halarcobacter anaerophilus TaxID=877500 RepID=A0A4Q0XXG1_9BACT|nr:thiamine pyrophosphate-binding protein [Halarcobacter anaerophilus]QDF30228.1 thiamine pyrophosphate-binding protein [Halarcobacter anaerophilus]RXJ62212.1 acetolactate synthase [Halarcobacter anaerophilus]